MTTTCFRHVRKGSFLHKIRAPKRHQGHLAPVRFRESTSAQGLVMVALFKDLLGVMRVSKKFWLPPLITALVLLGMLVVLTQDSSSAPFIYTLF